MKKTFGLSLLLMAGAMTLSAQQPSAVDRVNPIIGTNKMGHVFPGACVPHGIVALSPDTDTIPHNVNGVYQPRAYEYCAGYQHKDSTIVGFSHTHFSGTGHSDLGDILIMPTTGPLKLNPGTATDPDSGYRSRFSHDTEIATPGYYEVMLSDYGVKAQLTATERTGIHRYTYPADADTTRIILDMNHAIYNYDGKVLWASVQVLNDSTLVGYRITNGWARANYTYFAMKFSKPFNNYGYVDHKKPQYMGHLAKFKPNHNFPDIQGRQIVCYFDFDLANDPTLEIKVGLSAVSTEGAMKNLEAEAGNKSFEQIAAEARNAWAKELNIIEAEGTDDQLAMLYTSLYHTLINPSVYMDVDSLYRGLDQNIHQADGFTNYTIFSLWDTYRALMPLYNIINRERNTDMIESMLMHYKQSIHHALPVWSHMGNENFCMIGYHAVPVLADAIAKGIKVDKPLALEAMVSSSTIPYYGNLKEYMELGYVPFDKNSTGASNTLEYAFDDWTIYKTAKDMGEDEIAATYKKRALNYRNVFDRNLGLARARYSDGTWKKDFHPLGTHGEGFLEGNSWNYSFYAPQDVEGLKAYMGGDKRFIEKLDSIFTMYLPDEFFAETEDVTRDGILGNYVHGNEVSQHIPYLYAWTSQPWKTQYWVREIMNKMYKNNIDGLCGNDDCGQMSAWYIFTAMGFYPVAPGTDQYVIGAPYLPYMKVNFENGKSLVIRADKVSDKNRYVQSVTLNGEPVKTAYLTHDQIMNGGELNFVMGPKPNKKRLFTPEQRPYSLTQGE